VRESRERAESEREREREKYLELGVVLVGELEVALVQVRAGA